MGKGIVKLRYVILAIFIALIVVSVILLPDMISKVNYDLTSYLPEGYETHDGYEFLSENFHIHGDVEIGVKTTRDKIRSVAEKVVALDGVTNAVWAEYLEMLVQFGVYDIDDEDFLSIYKVLVADEDGNAPAISLVTDGKGNTTVTDDGAAYNWALLITMEYPPSSQEAIKIFGQITDILDAEVGSDENGTPLYSMSGMTEQANALYETVFDEIWLYCVIAGIVVLILLLVTTNSLIEPIVLLLTMVISIIIVKVFIKIITVKHQIRVISCAVFVQIGKYLFAGRSYIHKILNALVYQIEIPVAVKHILGI